MNAYQGDSPSDYVVEPTAEADLHNPKSLAQIRIRDNTLGNGSGDIWVKQEHDKHSNGVEYQADSP